MKIDWLRGYIGRELIAYFLLISVVPLLLLVFIVINQANNQARDQATNQMEAVSEVKNNDIVRLLSNSQTALELILADPRQYPRLVAALEAPDPRIAPIQQVIEFFDEKTVAQSIFTELFIFTRAGEVRASTNIENLASQVNELDYFANSFTETRPHPPYYDETDNINVIITVPIINDAGEVVGAFAGRLNAQELADVMSNRVGMGDTGETYLVSTQNYLITPSRFAGYELVDTYTSEGINQALSQNSGTGQYENYRNASVIGAYRWIPELGVAMIAEIEEAEALAALNNIRNFSIFGAVVAGLIAVGIGFTLTRRITSPIEQLTQVASAVSSGDYQQRVDIRQQNEIGQLATAFNTMKNNLVQTLNERNEYIDQIKAFQNTLEQRVSDRTRDLKLAGDVSRQIAAELDLNTLLPDMTEQTRKAFDLYHVSIFIYDNQAKELSLMAGTGEAGEKMVAEGRKFSLDDPKGLVPKAAQTLKPLIVNDVTASADHIANPNLPLTRSEAVFPIAFGGELLGVLDLQATQTERFQQEGIEIFISLADQIAIALRNAQLFTAAQAARDDAERASRVKSQFLAAMSHELRTPLNGIINFTGFVADEMVGPLNERQSKFLYDAIANAEHLLALINDVLDISKIEAGSLRLFVENNINIGEELETIIRTGETLLEGKPVELKIDIDQSLPLIQGDKRRIRQIILNIMSNACKFTDTGHVELKVKQENNHILFTLDDTGVGIAPEEQESVFQAFSQTQSGLRKGGGTGLGMPISQKLAEAHGGRLWLDSMPGRGTTVFVEIPIELDPLKIAEQTGEESYSE